MSTQRRPPILVTGSHRSGTTWVGRTIAASPNIAYLDEPFSLRHRPGVLRTRFRYWFPYLTGPAAAPVAADLRRTFAYRYSYAAELRAIESARDAGRMARDAARFARWRARRARPLLKDPIAILAVPWLAAEFRAQPVVLIRHPAAFASSLKRMGWTHDFSHFLRQPGLVDDLVPGLRPEIESFAAEPRDVIDQAALLWVIIHTVIDRYRREHPDWAFVRHEDLSTDPFGGFRDLFSRLALEYTGAVDRYIAESTGAANPAEARSGVTHELRRDSSANVHTWRSRLDAGEVQRVRDRTGAVASRFYSDAEW
jgi:Sulfotransferase family